MPRTVRALFLACGTALLAILIRRIGLSIVVDMLRRVGWGVLWVSCVYAVHVAVRAAALWRSLIARSLPYWDVFRIRLSGEAIELLTYTGPFLAEPAKGWLLKRHGIETADAFGAIAVEYLLYTLVSAWMAAAALSILLARGALPSPLHGPVAIAVACALSFTAGCCYAALSGKGLIVPIIRASGLVVGRRRAETAALGFDPVERVLVRFMHEHPSRLVEVIAIEAVSHALLALEIAIVLGALGFSFDVGDPLIIEGGVKVIGAAFFFVPGQLGASESIYTVLAVAVGFPAASGLTIALVRRIRALIVAGIGLAALATTRAS